MFGQINLLTQKAPMLAKHEYKIGQNMRYTIDGGKLFNSNSSKSRVEDIGDNIAGTLVSKNGYSTYTFNVMPGVHTVDYIKKFLARKTDELNTAFAFLCGGRAYDGSQKSALSNSLYAGIANILDGFNIPTAMICGKYSDSASDNMSVHGHIINVWGENIDKMKPLMTKEDLSRKLEDEYETVELPDIVGVASFAEEPSYIEANNYYESKLRSKAAG